MKQVSQIAKSIREFGFITPILIDENYVVISGHQRLLAAKSLGLEIIPTISLPEDTWDSEPHCVVPVKHNESKHERKNGGRWVKGKYGIGKSLLSCRTADL